MSSGSTGLMTCSIIAARISSWEISGVLGGNQHGVDPLRLAESILNRDLAFAIRAQPFEGIVLADFAQAAGEFVRQVNRHRHEGGGFVAGETATSCPGRLRQFSDLELLLAYVKLLTFGRNTLK